MTEVQEFVLRQRNQQIPERNPAMTTIQEDVQEWIRDLTPTSLTEAARKADDYMNARRQQKTVPARTAVRSTVGTTYPTSSAAPPRQLPPPPPATSQQRFRQPSTSIQEENETSISEFQLIGFGQHRILKIPLFSLFILVYFVILTGNILIISLVLSSQSLRSPMYFFLSHLSLCDVLCTTNIIPNMLRIILVEAITMPVTNCIIQFYIFGGSTTTESFLLTVMSYDRYLAICRPLHYISIMDLKLCLNLAVWSWLLGFVLTLYPGILVGMLKFCGPNVIDHFFCDLAPFLSLTCSDNVHRVEIEIIVSSVPVILFPFVFIIATYGFIFVTILRIPSKIGRQKAFSTCSSHLIIVCTYYGTLIIVYMVPSQGHFFNVNKALSLLYIVVTPLCNPIIYSLRNKDIHSVLWKMLRMM
ncbi:olfactory receptor 11A1-like [Pelobates fuscus]|uniref:olfactory receptor 11A1-like n=1 Tax=Pelobates fuscus TaxID=191477 RepID=UPI002FE4C3EB